MRIVILIISTLILCGCEKQYRGGEVSEYEVNSNSLIKTEHCLFQHLGGEPTTGGCWEIVSLPSGSTITQADLGTEHNPCIEFENQPCPADYVFQYQACCGDTTCVSPANLTICLTCDPPVCNVIITGTCN